MFTISGGFCNCSITFLINKIDLTPTLRHTHTNMTQITEQISSCWLCNCSPTTDHMADLTLMLLHQLYSLKSISCPCHSLEPGSSRGNFTLIVPIVIIKLYHIKLCLIFLYAVMFKQKYINILLCLEFLLYTYTGCPRKKCS